MTIRELFDFLATLYENQIHDPNPVPEIKARLIWRDENNAVICEKIVDFGFSSGLYPYLTIEMSNGDSIQSK